MQVQFVYQEPAQRRDFQPSFYPLFQPSTGLNAATLTAQRSTEWLTTFHRAVLSGDSDWMLSLLEAIGNNEEVTAHLCPLIRSSAAS